MLLFIYKRHSNSMANQGAPNNQPCASGGNILTGAHCSLSQMPPKRFTTHQALTQILADDGDASNYGNDTGSDFEIEISVDSCHYGDSRSESDATKPHACQSSIGQVDGRRHGTGRVPQNEMGASAPRPM